MSCSNDFVSDNIEANRVVKTFAIEADEIKRMRKLNKRYIYFIIKNYSYILKFYWY